MWCKYFCSSWLTSVLEVLILKLGGSNVLEVLILRLGGSNAKNGTCFVVRGLVPGESHKSFYGLGEEKCTYRRG